MFIQNQWRYFYYDDEHISNAYILDISAEMAGTKAIGVILRKSADSGPPSKRTWKPRHPSPLLSLNTLYIFFGVIVILV